MGEQFNRKDLWDVLRMYVRGQLHEGNRSVYEGVNASVGVSGKLSESFGIVVDETWVSP